MIKKKISNPKNKIERNNSENGRITAGDKLIKMMAPSRMGI